ncbi:hypothetical protein M3Y96_00849200 [Aphelenchoides besseyi]|nr:hypothetical protein M3Y96_00849200 [Aphelenchoides besseyi]
MDVEDESQLTETQDSSGVSKSTKKRSAASKIFKLTSRATTTRRLKVAEPFVLSNKRVKNEKIAMQSSKSKSASKRKPSKEREPTRPDANPVASTSEKKTYEFTQPGISRKKKCQRKNSGTPSESGMSSTNNS